MFQSLGRFADWNGKALTGQIKISLDHGLDGGNEWEGGCELPTDAGFILGPIYNLALPLERTMKVFFTTLDDGTGWARFIGSVDATPA